MNEPIAIWLDLLCNLLCPWIRCWITINFALIPSETISFVILLILRVVDTLLHGTELGIVWLGKL